MRKCRVTAEGCSWGRWEARTGTQSRMTKRKRIRRGREARVRERSWNRRISIRVDTSKNIESEKALQNIVAEKQVDDKALEIKQSALCTKRNKASSLRYVHESSVAVHKKSSQMQLDYFLFVKFQKYLDLDVLYCVCYFMYTIRDIYISISMLCIYIQYLCIYHNIIL